MFADEEAGADMFAGPGRDGIGGVDVEVKRIFHVRCHAAPCEPDDVFELVDQARKIIEVAKRRTSIEPALQVERLHRRSAGAEAHFPAADLEVVAAVLAMQNKGFRGLIDDVFNQAAREPEPAVIIGPAAENPPPVRSKHPGTSAMPRSASSVSAASWIRVQSASDSGL